MHNKNIAIFIENYLAGGCDKIARDLIDSLEYKMLYLYVNNGSDLKILCAKELPENVEIINYNIVSIQELGKFANSFKEQSKIIYIILKFFNLFVKYPILIFYVAYFYRLFKKVNIDVFFSNNGGYPGGEFNRMATIAYSFFKGKNYHIIHNLATKPFFKPFIPIEYLIDYFLDKSCEFICVSNQTREYLLNNRYIKSLPTVIYNGVEEYNGVKRKRNNTTIKLLNIGLLGERKNQLLIVEALQILNRKGYNNIELYCLGDEEDIGYVNMLKKKIEEYNLHNIYFKGFCEPYEYYELCDIFVLSSIIESFALVRVEAMSVGMPVITTNVGDAHIQVENGQNGYIIDNVDDMAKTIEIYVNNNTLIQKHSQKGKQIYKSKFTIDRMIKEYKLLIT